MYDDPGIVQSLRFRATDGDRERLQSTIPVVDVERLESPYPPWKQQSFDKDMSEENQLLWQAKIMGTAKHDPRRVSPTVDKLDESKFKGIIHRGDNVCVRIDGGLTLFIFRNAVSHPGVLGYLAQVARDNCMQRRNVRVSELYLVDELVLMALSETTVAAVSTLVIHAEDALNGHKIMS